eukprot:CAMPEP_0114143402 /NCGR_PEP_ID=MMETSP0043_2-20121206/18969_1 /TAXON_ID=464988 /ORGANISM="Hemiselmis andersenii, Strain CCMP644" /LENGTH=556 /DNA_ID=CAMNT_0001237701 /DNA_START=155 /DNA_END=1825 /DNA_ORIENTATION=+
MDSEHQDTASPLGERSDLCDDAAVQIGAARGVEKAKARKERREMHPGGEVHAHMPHLAIPPAVKRISGPPKQWQAGGELFPVIRTRVCLCAYESDLDTFLRERPQMCVFVSPHVEAQMSPGDRQLGFAPASISTIHAFCLDFRAKLADPATLGKPVVIPVDIFDGKSVTNAAFLLAAFLILECEYTVEEAVHPFEQIVPMPYVDYSMGITIFDAIRGLGKAVSKGWVIRAAPAPSSTFCRVCPELAILPRVRLPKPATLHAAGITAVALTGNCAPPGFDEATLRDAGLELHQMLPLQRTEDNILELVVDEHGIVGVVGSQGPALVCIQLILQHNFLSNEAAAYVWMHFQECEKPGIRFMDAELLAVLQFRDPLEVQEDRVQKQALRQSGLSSPKARHPKVESSRSLLSGGKDSSSPVGSARPAKSPLGGVQRSRSPNHSPNRAFSPLRQDKGGNSPLRGLSTPRSAVGSKKNSPLEAVKAHQDILPQSAIAGPRFDRHQLHGEDIVHPDRKPDVAVVDHHYVQRTGARHFPLEVRGGGSPFAIENRSSPHRHRPNS